MASTPVTIQSIAELQERITSIVKALNADQALLRAAAANPVFALEELGYRIPEPLLREFDARVRFTAAERERMAQLVRQVREAAGFDLDPDDPEQLHDALFNRLGLPTLSPEPVRVEVSPEASRAGDTSTGQAQQARPAHQAPQVQRAEPGQQAQPLDLTSAPTPPRGDRPASGAGPIRPQPTIPLHRLAVRYHASAAGGAGDVLAELRGAHPVIEPLLAYRELAARHAPFAPRALYDRIRAGTVEGPSLRLRARIHRSREG